MNRKWCNLQQRWSMQCTMHSSDQASCFVDDSMLDTKRSKTDPLAITMAQSAARVPTRNTHQHDIAAVGFLWSPRLAEGAGAVPSVRSITPSLSTSGCLLVCARRRPRSVLHASHVMERCAAARTPSELCDPLPAPTFRCPPHLLPAQLLRGISSLFSLIQSAL